MKNRLLSLVIALTLACSLLVFPASAVTSLTDIFDQLITENQDTINKLLNANNLVLSGNCGKGGTANVKYEIYRLDHEQAQAITQYYSDKLSDLKSGLNEIASKFGFSTDETTALTGIDLSLDPDGDTYYAVKITGTGEMEDYTLTNKAPWSGKKEQLAGDSANMDKQLVAAYIDTGVTNVGKRAFFGLDALRAVYLSNTVKIIDEKAFETCDRLAVIDFPNSLERIERRAFYACDALTFARMKSCTKLNYIGKRAFGCCTRLTNVNFPAGLKEIDDFAFIYDHVLGTVQFALPEKLSKLGTGAFWWCTHLGIINEVTIPATLTSIGPWAFFANFDMKELTFSSGEQALTIGTGAFSGCRALTTVRFADRVKHINDFAFAACDSLTYVTFGTGKGTDLLHITTIGKQAFTSLNSAGLEALTRVANTMADNDEETATYLDHTLDLYYGIRQVNDNEWGMTPLTEAVFTYDPISSGNIEPAASDFNSFPKTSVIIYPTQGNNAQAFYKWNAAISSDGVWEGYQTRSDWDGHVHRYGLPEEVPANCTESGFTIKTCTICGKIIKVGEEIPALGHDWGEWVVTKEATATEAGEETRVCKRDPSHIEKRNTDPVTPLAIIGSPADCTGKAGSIAAFAVEAEGSGLTYRWWYSDDGGDMWIQSSFTSAVAVFKIDAEMNGRMYRCVVTDRSGNSVISGRARLFVVAPITITTNPEDYTGKENSTARFVVAASGTGTLHYQWQVSTNGGRTWSQSSVKSAVYAAKLTAEKDNRMVRCIVTDDYGNSVTSEPAAMHIVKQLAITKQPVDYKGALNSQARFTVAAVGDGLSYQWQVSTNGGRTWSNSSIKSAVYSAKLTAEKNNRMVRCVVTDNYGNRATSEPAAMKITTLSIVTQPVDYTGAENSTARFTVVATGEGLTYQWQVSTNGGRTWSNSSIKSAVYAATLTAAKDGRMVRCIITDANNHSVTSSAATMRIG